MKIAITLVALTLCGSITAVAQTQIPGCGCGVSAAGGFSCDCLGSIRKDGQRTELPTVCGSHQKVQVTSMLLRLAPGAPLHRTAPAEDELVIGLDEGELVNQSKSPPVYMLMSAGDAYLLAKDEPYLLRNIGKKALLILVISFQPVKPGGQ